MLPLKIDKVTHPPTLLDRHGRAWRVDLAAANALANIKPEHDATLACWLVEAPWAHMAWHSYSLTLIHLRPLPDDGPIEVYLEGATHEVWVHALDPNHPRDAMIGTGRMRPLMPLNFAAQFIERTDEAARARIEAAVRDIIAGRLSPDTDFVSVWAELFGGNMLRDRAK